MGSLGPAQPAVPVISLADPERRRPQIIAELMEAATGVGFFHVSDFSWAVPVDEVQDAFKLTRRFFDCSNEQKSKMPVDAHTYLGWERDSEVSPQTGFPDHKESLQVAYDQRGWGSEWPTDACVPGFRAQAVPFMRKCHSLCLFLLEALAEGLKLPLDTFSKLLDNTAPDCNSAMRTMNYYTVEGQSFPEGHMRLTPHTDITCITLLFHRVGETGLEVCPGRKVTTDYAHGDEWIPCDPVKDAITCNLGDGLMYCSDDRLKSNFHRIKAPNPGSYQGPRHTVVYFTNPNLEAVCQGPEGKYPPITGQQMAHVMELAHQDKGSLEGLIQRSALSAAA